MTLHRPAWCASRSRASWRAAILCLSAASCASFAPFAGIAPLPTIAPLVDTASAGTLEVGDAELDLSGQIQLWNVYSLDVEDGAGNRVEDRWDAYIRRGRIAIAGTAHKAITCNVVFAYDNIGKNRFTSATGTPQDRDNGEFHLWDAIFTWEARPQWLYVTMGYFRPQVGRESITSAFNVNSLTKALTNSYPRRHLIGTGPGRETGVNVGGLRHPGRWGVGYNVGLFDADQVETGGLPDGNRWSPLVTARMTFTVGAPEMSRYRLAYMLNHFGDRDGATVALNYARQGETDVFTRNELLGIDLLWNHGPWTLDAEHDWLERRAASTSTDRVYHARLGYTFRLRNGQMLEPVYLYSGFEGDAASPIPASAYLKLQQLGLNWYVDRNRCKLNLHYAWQEGEVESAYIGSGVQLIFP